MRGSLASSVASARETSSHPFIDQMAKAKNATKAEIALAWILNHNNEITAIPGTRRIDRLEENLGAYNVHLTTEDMKLIETSIPELTIGNRY